MAFGSRGNFPTYSGVAPTPGDDLRLPEILQPSPDIELDPERRHAWQRSLRENIEGIKDALRNDDAPTTGGKILANLWWSGGILFSATTPQGRFMELAAPLRQWSAADALLFLIKESNTYWVRSLIETAALGHMFGDPDDATEDLESLPGARVLDLHGNIIPLNLVGIGRTAEFQQTTATATEESFDWTADAADVEGLVGRQTGILTSVSSSRVRIDPDGWYLTSPDGDIDNATFAPISYADPNRPRFIPLQADAFAGIQRIKLWIRSLSHSSQGRVELSTFNTSLSTQVTGQAVTDITDDETRSLLIRLTRSSDGASFSALLALSDDEREDEVPADMDPETPYYWTHTNNAVVAALAAWLTDDPRTFGTFTLDFAIVENSANWRQSGSDVVRDTGGTMLTAVEPRYVVADARSIHVFAFAPDGAYDAALSFDLASNILLPISGMDIYEDELYILSPRQNRYWVRTLAGSQLSTEVPSGGANIDIAVTASYVYVLKDNARVWISERAGTMTRRIDLPQSIASPTAITRDAAGNVYVLDSQRNKFFAFREPWLVRHEPLDFSLDPENADPRGAGFDAVTSKILVTDAVTGRVHAYTPSVVPAVAPVAADAVDLGNSVALARNAGDTGRFLLSYKDRKTLLLGFSPHSTAVVAQCQVWTLRYPR